MVALDLDRYDWHPGARSLVRATEATVEDRLPPRLRVREGAALELPHVLVLVDDPEHSVVEPVCERARRGAPLYDVELMDGAGRVRGWAVTEPAEIERVERALERLAQPEMQRAKYGPSDGDPFLYASGDGNHSLAAAKLLWERRKRALAPAELDRDPARFALVELVNVHDPGLRFEPIHRVVFGVDPERSSPTSRAAPARVRRHALRWVAATRSGVATLATDAEPLAVAALQTFLDELAARQPGGAHRLHPRRRRAARGSRAEPGRIGFSCPRSRSRALFPTVARAACCRARPSRSARPRRSASTWRPAGSAPELCARV